ncbi:unnamed protein product, partial [Brassica napus]
PRWDGELEDEKADNIVKAVFSSGWAWEQSHWLLCRNKTVDKCEGGDPSDEDRSWSDGAKLEDSVPSRTQSDAESRKKARESPGLDVETMKGEIVRPYNSGGSC